jgi:hypothetical protein
MNLKVGVLRGGQWWGIEAAGVADPILNEDADYAAEQLGMPGFVEGDRGTTILLVQPRFEQRSRCKPCLKWLNICSGTSGLKCFYTTEYSRHSV